MSTGSNLETEIKLHLPDVAFGRRILRRGGFRVSRRRTFEANLVFDRPDGRIRSSGGLLRLRQSGRESYLTYKGPAEAGKHKSREELETVVDRFDLTELIFSRLGFTTVFRYEKYRTEFRRPRSAGLIMLDETPIGVFLELEGPADWIDATALQLGFSQTDYITSSYGSLYLSACREQRIPPAHMVFGKPRR